MPNSDPSHLDGIRDLIEHLGDYYDQIISGELNWTELLESRMSASAIERINKQERGGQN